MTTPLSDLTLAILNFNLLPSRYLHPSWRSQYFPDSLLAILFSNDQAERHLSHHILKKLYLESSAYFEESWPYWKLVLATEEQILLYVKASGCLLLRDVLQHTVQRENVMYYRQLLGELYSFVLEKGPLLCPTHSTSTIAPEQFLEKAQELGWLTLIQATSLFPEAIAKRFMLKLPQELTRLKGHDTGLSALQAVTLFTRLCYEIGIR